MNLSRFIEWNPKRSHSVLWLFICFFVSCMAVFCKIERIPLYDSGVYAYVGSLIKEWKMPYVYAWDNKPPMIYFIDFIGVSLTPGSMMGIWIIEVLFLTLSTFLMSVFLYKNFKPTYLVLFSLIIPAGVNVFGFVNCTEVYAMLFNLIVLLIYFNMSDNNRLKYAYIGFFASMAFLTKQNQVGMVITICILMVLSAIDRREIIKLISRLAIIAVSFAILPFLIAFYYYNIGEITPLIEQVFKVNIYFSSLRSFGQKTYEVFYKNRLCSICIYYLLIWIYMVMFFIRYIFPREKSLFSISMCKLDIESLKNLFSLKIFNKYEVKADEGLNRITFLFIIINFPVEFVLYMLQGRAYSHYIVMLVIDMTLITVICFKSILILSEYQKLQNEREDTKDKEDRNVKVKARVGNLVLFNKALLILCIIFFLETNVVLFSLQVNDKTHVLINNNFSSILKEESSNINFSEYLVKRIIQETEQEDYVLVWGFTNGLNFASGRKSPAKHFYQIQLFLDGYTNEEKVNEFFDEIKTNKPKLVVDVMRDMHISHSATAEDAKIRFSGGNAFEYDKDYYNGRYVFLPGIEKCLKYILDNYRKIECGKNYDIYKLKGT